MSNPTATILAPPSLRRQTLAALEQAVEAARQDAIRPSADGSHRQAVQRYRVAWAMLVEARHRG